MIDMFFRRLISVRQESGTKPSDSLNFEMCVRAENRISRWFEFQHILSRKSTVSNICMYVD